jgi:hypothetical protein
MKTSNFDMLYAIAKNPMLVMKFEALIYATAEHLSRHDDHPYKNGTWKSEALGDGWFFLLSEERSWHIINVDNYSNATVGTKAFSIIAFIFALSRFSEHLYEKEIYDDLADEISDLYHNVLAFAQSTLNDEDYTAFCAVID